MAITHTVNFTLEVREAPDFFLAVVPLAGVADKGTVASFSVTSTAKGTFNKNINLILVGLPAGTTPAFSVNPIGPNGTCVLTIPTAALPVAPPMPLALTGTEV